MSRLLLVSSATPTADLARDAARKWASGPRELPLAPLAGTGAACQGNNIKPEQAPQDATGRRLGCGYEPGDLRYRRPLSDALAREDDGTEGPLAHGCSLGWLMAARLAYGYSGASLDLTPAWVWTCRSCDRLLSILTAGRHPGYRDNFMMPGMFIQVRRLLHHATPQPSDHGVTDCPSIFTAAANQLQTHDWRISS
jgi:hypothetical protein